MAEEETKPSRTKNLIQSAERKRERERERERETVPQYQKRVLVEMETERNKKRSSDSDDGERTTRPRVDEGDDRTVTEEEVEEFYAILRRMHEASKAIAVRKGSGGGVGGGGRRRGGAASSWVPAFKLEDFEEVGAVKVNGTETPANEAEINGGEARRRSAAVEEETVGEDGIPVCLDLNTEPEHKGLGHVKPERGGDSTAPRPNFY